MWITLIYKNNLITLWNYPQSGHKYFDFFFNNNRWNGIVRRLHLMYSASHHSSRNKINIQNMMSFWFYFCAVMIIWIQIFTKYFHLFNSKNVFNVLSISYRQTTAIYKSSWGELESRFNRYVEKSSLICSSLTSGENRKLSKISTHKLQWWN